MKGSLRLASLDLGTNSTRLLVADCDGSRTETVDRRMIITRLGEGVDRTRQLSPEAIERARVALSEYCKVITPLQPAGVAAVATSVLRDCENGEEFLDIAEEILGTRPRVLPGVEEARMSFLGAVSDLGEELKTAGDAGPALVFDIGGGSTELVTGDPSIARGGAEPPDDALRLKSVDVGCVRMSERFLTTDPPSPVSIGRMETYIVQVLRPAIASLLPEKSRGSSSRVSPGPAPWSLGVGLAGTVTTISGINMGLEEYDTDRIHHSKLTRDQVEQIFRKLASVPLDERKKVMGLEPGRADIIVGGAAVLRVVMDVARLEEILVSEKDILDGLVIDLYRRLTA